MLIKTKYTSPNLDKIGASYIVFELKQLNISNTAKEN